MRKMSTKTTLSHNKDYHLYKECFDKNLVYLQLDNPISLQVDMWEASEGKVTVAVSIETWRHVVEGWLKTHWAQNPDWDLEEDWEIPERIDLLETVEDKKEGKMK